MVWYFALVGIGILVAIIMLKKYYSHGATGAEHKKFCFECNKAFSDKHNECPKCGLKFGT